MGLFGVDYVDILNHPTVSKREATNRRFQKD